MRYLQGKSMKLKMAVKAHWLDGIQLGSEQKIRNVLLHGWNGTYRYLHKCLDFFFPSEITLADKEQTNKFHPLGVVRTCISRFATEQLFSHVKILHLKKLRIGEKSTTEL